MNLQDKILNKIYLYIETNEYISTKIESTKKRSEREIQDPIPTKDFEIYIYTKI